MGPDPPLSRRGPGLPVTLCNLLTSSRWSLESRPHHPHQGDRDPVCLQRAWHVLGRPRLAVAGTHPSARAGGRAGRGAQPHRGPAWAVPPRSPRPCPAPGSWLIPATFPISAGPAPCALRQAGRGVCSERQRTRQGESRMGTPGRRGGEKWRCRRQAGPRAGGKPGRGAAGRAAGQRRGEEPRAWGGSWAGPLFTGGNCWGHTAAQGLRASPT